MEREAPALSRSPMKPKGNFPPSPPKRNPPTRLWSPGTVPFASGAT
jgi:hypothetical protein